MKFGIEFVWATLRELQLATLNVLPFVLHCNARVSALVIVLSDSPCESTLKWETCPILKEDNRWFAISWSICDENCNVSRCIESDSF
jgi:hypothetical protein